VSSYEVAFTQLISTRMDNTSVGAAVKLVHISFFVVLSSVPCEDGFRDMNIIKNDLRNTMATATMNNIMMIYKNGPDFKTERELCREVIKEAVQLWLRRGTNRPGARVAVYALR
jgi:hypothetical protein